MRIATTPSQQPWAQRRRSRSGRAGVLAATGACLFIGAAIVRVPPAPLLLALVVGAVLTAVVIHPQVAAYVLLACTPLIAGLDRGAGIPLLRPSEALAALVGCGLLIRGVLIGLRSGLPRLRLSAIDGAIVILTITGSILPFLWMLARGVQVTSDDVLYGLVLWKFLGIYLIFRTSVRTAQQVRRCLWIAMLTGVAVSVIAMLQALGVPPVTAFVSRYFSPAGDTQAVLNSRGGSTFGLPIALADYLLFNLAIAAGFLIETRSRRLALWILSLFFVGGVLASGEFSALIGLVVAVVVLALVARRASIVLYLLPAFLISISVLRPVIETRLLGFQSVSGIPVSWTGRLYNLTNYFWPELFSHDNFVLGVRLAARVVVRSQLTGYVWIESGYTWLLWAGGIPFFLAFVAFVWIGISRGITVARIRSDAIGTVGLAVSVGLSVVAVLMLFDPHLTYRGAADLLFALVAMLATASSATRRAPALGGDREPADRPARAEVPELGPG
jgi:hypothetical protein